jgi:hypothetical protein
MSSRPKTEIGMLETWELDSKAQKSSTIDIYSTLEKTMGEFYVAKPNTWGWSVLQPSFVQPC